MIFVQNFACGSVSRRWSNSWGQPPSRISTASPMWHSKCLYVTAKTVRVETFAN